MLAALVLTKLTVPTTVDPAAAAEGKPTKLALISGFAEPIGVTTVTVLVGAGSGVVLVPTAVLVMLPTEAVTEAFITKVRVWLIAKLAVVAAALAPAIVVVPLLPDALIRLSPVLRMSVSVTLSAVLGPRLTSVTV